jgi:hypothetical protein
VFGLATNTDCYDTNYQSVVAGVYGQADYSGSGVYGGYFVAPAIALNGYSTGVGGTGVAGTGSGYGVAGTTGGGFGVYGSSDSSIGVVGVAGTNLSIPNSTGYGVFGTSSLYDGVHGEVNNFGNGVSGENLGGGYGVYGTASNDAGHFLSTGSGHDGVYADAGSSGYAGVYAQCGSDSGYGVYGYNANNIGVYGAGNTGVWGYGVFGVAGQGNGSNSIGVYGECSGSNCAAGYFSGSVTISGNLNVEGSCSGCSDLRLKKDVKPLEGAIDQLLQLKGVTYEWIDPSLHEHEAGHGVGKQRGFIAQDVEKVFPNWVKDDGYTTPDGEKYRTLELRQIEALEVESIRTLKAENDALKARMRALETGPGLVVSSVNGLGFGIGGLALAGAIVFTRRKRSEDRSAS